MVSSLSAESPILLALYPDVLCRRPYSHSEALGPNLRYQSGHLGLWFERTRQVRYPETCRCAEWSRVELNRYKVCVFRERDEECIHCSFVGPKPHVDGAPMAV